jgi:hypothetical protein
VFPTRSERIEVAGWRRENLEVGIIRESKSHTTFAFHHIVIHLAASPLINLITAFDI